METNTIYSVLVNAVIIHRDKILISQRSFDEKHEGGKWTVPGGKIENNSDEEETKDIVQQTLVREVFEEVGIEISQNMMLIANNTFKRSTGQMVLALVFLCTYKKGRAKALDDTINVAWVTKNKLKNYAFAPNVREYILQGFKVSSHRKKQL